MENHTVETLQNNLLNSIYFQTTTWGGLQKGKTQIVLTDDILQN
jgi:hypothetical protein